MHKVWLFSGRSQISHQRCLPFHSLYFIYCTLHVLNQYAQGDCSNFFKILLYRSGAFLKFLYCFFKAYGPLCCIFFIKINILLCVAVMHDSDIALLFKDKLFQPLTIHSTSHFDSLFPLIIQDWNRMHSLKKKIGMESL